MPSTFPSDLLPLLDVSKIRFALLFGSIVTDRFNQESDIDLAVYFSPETNFQEERLRLSVQIADSTHHEADLIVLNTADIIITSQVLAHGSLLYCQDQTFFNLYKAGKISEYLDFKLSRKDLEHRFLNRRIYA